MKENLNLWINGLSPFEEGLLLSSFGLALSFYSGYLHKTWKAEGYRLFRPFRRPGKTQSEDNYVIIMYTRTLFMTYGGYAVTLFGLYKIGAALSLI